MAKEFLTNSQDKTYLISEQEKTEIQDQDPIDLHQISDITTEMSTTQLEQWLISIKAKHQEDDSWSDDK